MGAADFMTVGVAPTAGEAFSQARDEAAHEYGHGGYTGTIAEKQNFTMFPLPGDLPEGVTIGHYTRLCVSAPFDGDPDKYWVFPGTQITVPEYMRTHITAVSDLIEDKWGPAGCFDITDTPHGQRRAASPESRVFLFIGWASS